MPTPPLKLIRASAGSGKTFSLTAHYLILLFRYPAKYREILAVTFTNKATAEMKQRILGALAELADAAVAHPKFLPVVREQYADLSDSDIRLRAAEVYRNILHDYSRFAVNTIDGFVQQVIRSFAFELNLDSGYRLELNEQRVKDELAKGLNRRMEHDASLLEWVTTLAIERIDEGKDWNYERALDGIAGEIFKERYFPFQEAMRVMGDTKGDEFARLREMLVTETGDFLRQVQDAAHRAHTVFQRSGVLADELTGKSRHPVYKLAKVADGDIGVLPAIVALADDPAAWPNKSLKDPSAVNALYGAINPVLKELYDVYTGGIARYATFSAIYKNAPYLRLMQEMADLVSEYRTENRALLISDAQYLLKGITASNADDPSFIWEKTGNRFHHFLFDEFQDTSGFQWDNFLPLVRNAVASHDDSGYPGHLVVGDVKQSIYRWRNGDWRILHSKVSADLGKELVTELNLEYNRRSSVNIIDFNNFLYETLPRFLQERINVEFDKANVPDEVLETYRNSIVGSYAGSFQKTTDQTAPGGKIDVLLIPRQAGSEEGSNGVALARLAEKLITLLRDDRFRMKDVAVLVKKNREAEDVIRYLLSRQTELTAAAGKTFQLISGEALRIANDPAVELLVKTIALLTAREQEQGIFRVHCARLYFELHHPDAGSIALSPADWTRLAKEPLHKLGDLLPAQLCENYREYLQLPVTGLAEKLVAVYGLNEARLDSHLPYLLAFRDLTASFTSAGDAGLRAFLEWWETDGSSKSLPGPEGQDAVTVMTVHKSKGLEFGAVLIPFCNWELNRYSGFLKKILWVDARRSGLDHFGSLPVDYSAALRDTVFAENYFEELLLNYMDTLNTLYVATTRAKNYLGIFLPQKGVSSFNMYSVFNDLFGPANPYSDRYVLDGNGFSFGETVVAAVEEAQHEETIMIGSYAVHDHAGYHFAQPEQNAGAWYNEEQRRGSVLHEILAAATNNSQIDTLVNRFIQDGSLKATERGDVIRSAEAVFGHAEISSWFRDADRVISEKNILGAGGAAERPDKVFVIGDELVLLDFKFGAPRESHRRQLLHYRELLLQMGRYGAVKAYLWYAQTNTLLAV